MVVGFVAHFLFLSRRTKTCHDFVGRNNAFVTGDHHTLGTKKTMALHIFTSLNYDYLQKLDMSNVDVLTTQYGSPFIRASLNPLLSLL